MSTKMSRRIPVKDVSPEVYEKLRLGLGSAIVVKQSLLEQQPMRFVCMTLAVVQCMQRPL